MLKKKITNKEEIFKKIESFVENREEIIFAYIFGSFIEDKIFNDIDLAIYIDKDNTLTKEIFYEVELSRRLEEKIKIPVDVIVLNRASNFILHRVSNGKLIKNTDDDMRINFITTHWKEYWDFKNKIHEHVKGIKAWK
jgi:hypothetical protein